MVGAITKSADEIVQDLNKARAEVVKIFQNAGIVGLATQVIFQGRTIWTTNMGYQDREKKWPVSEHTVFPIGALSQGFAAACVAQRVYKGGLSYDNKISALLPGIKNKDATVGDLLGHRTGLQAPNHLMQIERAGRLNPRLYSTKAIIEAFNNLEPRASLRSQFLHNSMGYALLGEIISTQPGCYRTAHILKHLQMRCTQTRLHETAMFSINTVRYSVGSKGQIYAHKRAESYLQPDWRMPSIAVGGMASTTHDLARYCIALNKARKLRGPTKADEGREARLLRWLFPDVDLLFNPLQPMGDVAPGEEAKKSHAAGWATCTLPAAIGDIGINPELIEMPILGTGSAPATLIWNQSKYHGTNAFVALLPEYEAAVIVLSNTTTGNDTTDWIGQLLIQTLLDNPYKNDYPYLASLSVLNARQKYSELIAKLEHGRETKKPKRSLEQYVGTYENALGESIDVMVRSYWGRQQDETDTEGEDGAKGRKKRKKSPLKIAFHPETLRQFYRLHHHDGDTFTWHLSWNGMLRAQRGVSYRPEYYLIRFQPNQDDMGMHSLVWVNDPAKPKGEVFTRRGLYAPSWKENLGRI